MGGQFLEDVTDLNTANIPLTVWANGVIPSIGYTVLGPGLAIPGYSFMGMYLKWDFEPVAPITGSFQFFFRVRFAMDAADFEEFLYQIWTVGGDSSKNGVGHMKLTSARAPGI